MLRAMEQIRRMRGGPQSHLMRCSDGNYYVVKFQNHPQRRRILVNALLGTRLAGRMGLPTAPVSAGEPRCDPFVLRAVWKAARLWERLEKGVRADYSYRKNGTRGFVQTLSVTRAPARSNRWPTPSSASARKSNPASLPLSRAPERRKRTP
jgi:hypothetical protein